MNRKTTRLSTLTPTVLDCLFFLMVAVCIFWLCSISMATEKESRKKTPIKSLVSTEVTVEIDQIPIKTALNHLREILEVDMVVLYRNERSQIGIDPYEKISLRATETPAIDVLESILAEIDDPFEDATWQIHRNRIIIGFKSQLAHRRYQEVRRYPIQDFLIAPTMFDDAPGFDLDSALDRFNQNSLFGGRSVVKRTQQEREEYAAMLMDLIQQTIEPEGWRSAGGSWATINRHKEILIIRAPDFIHRQINGYE